MRPIYIVHHQPVGFAGRSGFPPLIELLDAKELHFDMAWQKLERTSWRLSHALRQWIIRHYGSTWHGLVPYRDEWRMARQVRESAGATIHFIWGEFSAPRHARWFRKRGNRVVGTFHCTIRRLPNVLGRFRCWDSFDAWSVTSKTQIPFFLEHGVRERDIRVLPLGVDTDYFCPDPAREAPASGPLRAILIGKTERDHEFTAQVLKALPPGVVELSVCTHREYHPIYRDAPGAKVLPHVPDDQLLKLYQSAELMIMPFLDCTTNDALMECMACGTPIMTNRTGGIPEYVNESCNPVMGGKVVGDWVDRLVDLHRHRERLAAWRAPVRAWAERFGWKRVGDQYRAFYEGAPP